MKKTQSAGQLLSLNAYWLGLSFLWNALHPIILPAVLLTFVPDAQKNTYLGLLTFAGLIVAMAVQPISGSASDRWASGYGRRRPLMLIGSLLAALFLLVVGAADGFGWLCVGYIGLQVSANIAQGPLQGLMRDRVPTPQLGAMSSVKVVLDIGGLVLSSVVAGRLMGRAPGGPTAAILVVLGVLIASAAVTILSTPEAASGTDTGLHSADEARPQGVQSGPRAEYWWLIAERAVFLLGIYGLQAFGQYYLRDVLRVPNPPRQAGDLLTAIGAGVLLLALAGGRLTDRFGAKRVLYAASGLTALGMLYMVMAAPGGGFLLSASLVGAGLGLFLTSNWALANQLAPEAQSGKFLGLTNLATGGSAAAARLQGPAVDYLNAAWPAHWMGYKILFLFGALCIGASTTLLRRIK